VYVIGWRNLCTLKPP